MKIVTFVSESGLAQRRMYQLLDLRLFTLQSGEECTLSVLSSVRTDQASQPKQTENVVCTQRHTGTISADGHSGLYSTAATPAAAGLHLIPPCGSLRPLP